MRDRSEGLESQSTGQTYHSGWVADGLEAGGLVRRSLLRVRTGELSIRKEESSSSERCRGGGFGDLAN